MFRNKTLIKTLAIFFILEMLLNTVAPSISYALTAGPTAPEATSFEPVDTTDMVNLMTGDLAYNMPLLEVPGPSGGYPLSLSYHPGIMTNEEASWVGLGWTLNPGEINRNVNGYVDDISNSRQSNHVYWEGGESNTFGVGVGVVAGQLDVSAGIEVGWDTYQGFGVGMNFGANIAGTGFRSELDPWGNDRSRASFSAAHLAISGDRGHASVDVGFSTDFESKPRTQISTSGGYSGMGLSILSDTKGNVGIGVSALGVGGSTTVGNSRSGKVSTKSWGISVPIPYTYLMLSYKYFRYWIDETENINTNGIFHFPVAEPESDFFNDNSFDVYSLGTPESFIENLQPERLSGGTFPAFDDYRVNAQGIAGSIQPHVFQKSLVDDNNRNYINGGYKYDIIQYNMSYDNKPIEFRFSNDFSNQYQYNAANLSINNSSVNSAITYDFGQPTTGKNNDGLVNNNLIGSRFIKYYTNSQIISSQNTERPDKFIETESTGFSRSSMPGEQIGAFTIVNESGVRYHFSLPAYTSHEYQYSELINHQYGDKYNEVTKDVKYAYTWYLTAVTGPDYIDRGQVGLDKDDWGYWVEFDYGKWTDIYSWRNPGKGMKTDIDYESQGFSEGQKEVYYLDVIRTKTHTALFVKSLRHDGKSTGSKAMDRNGGFTPKSNASPFCETYITRPTSLLKLDRIHLLANSDLDLISLSKSAGSALSQSFSYGCGETFNYHFYQNVLDVDDIESSGNAISDQSLRIIKFETSNDLVPETDNSFDFNLVNVTNPSQNDSDYPRFGKLTLDALQILGKGGATLIPPTRFYYDLEDAQSGFGTITKENGSDEKNFELTSIDSDLNTGDILRMSNNNQVYYAIITSITDDSYKITILGKTNPALNSSVRWVQTKNPPYNEDAYDHWGMYKPDFKSQTNESISRLTTVLSGQHADVWSLRKVESSLGAEIKLEYEPDSYSKAVLYRNGSFIINSFTEWNKQAGTVSMNILNGGDFLASMVKPGDLIDFSIMYNENTPSASGNFNPDIGNYTATVVEASGQSIRIALSFFVDYFGFYKTEPDDQLSRLIWTGNAFLRNDTNVLGGGLRVSKISVTNVLVGMEKETLYDYQKPDRPTLSSGVTSYEPVGINKFNDLGNPDSDIVKRYKNEVILTRFSNLLVNARQAPPPGVMYEFVTLKETLKRGNTSSSLPTKTTYQFEVFNEGMTGIDYDHQVQSGLGSINYKGFNLNNNIIYTTNVTVRDFSSFIGTLKGSSVYSNEGFKLSETKNHFLHDQVNISDLYNQADIFNAYKTQYPSLVNNGFMGQGIMHETYVTSRFAKDERENFPQYHKLRGLISKIETFPKIPIGSTHFNYKTGTMSQTQDLEFDFYSGQISRSLETDGYGNAYEINLTPAYLKYPEMGPAALGGDNMLTQEGSSYTYKVDPTDYNTKLGLVSASVQTWSDQILAVETGVNASVNQPGIWRKHTSYSYVGDTGTGLLADGLYPLTNNSIPSFTSWLDAPNGNDPIQQGWQKNIEITLYDVCSHALEAQDLNGLFAATKMTPDQTRVSSTVANARYNEFTYSGFEDNQTSDNQTIGNGISIVNGVVDNTQFHTGINSIKINVDQVGLSGLTSTTKGSITDKMKVSFWIKPQTDPTQVSGNVNVLYGYSTPGQQPTMLPLALQLNTAKSANGWFYITADIPVPLGLETAPVDFTVQIKNSLNTVLYLDDFRIHPYDAAMTSYVYNKWGELSHILDNNNLYTEYRYDGMGRLTDVYRESFQYGVNQTSKTGYHYAKQN